MFHDTAVWVRPDFPLELAALIGCSVTTGFGSVVNSAGLRVCCTCQIA